jgi:excisionase family DNA binding protein
MAAPVPVVVPERHLYTVAEAAVLLAMSRSVVYELIRSGRLRTVTEGRSRRVPAKAINDYIELLNRESERAGYGQAS